MKFNTSPLIPMKNAYLFLFVGVFLAFCGKSQNEKQTIASKKVLNAYQEWVYKKVKSGQYWYESKWKEEFNKRSNPLMIDNCKDGLPDDFDHVRYGDINQDGELDAIATIGLLPCESGTAHRFDAIDLVFLSGSSTSYSTLETFEEIISTLGLTGDIDTITKNGVIYYTSLEYGADDAMCCPSVKKKVKIKYQNGKFIKLQ